MRRSSQRAVADGQVRYRGPGRRPPQQGLDAEPGRRHGVVPRLKLVKLAREREGRRGGGGLGFGPSLQLDAAGEKALVRRIAFGDSSELRAACRVGLVAAWPGPHDVGPRAERVPLQHDEAAPEAGRSELVDDDAGALLVARRKAGDSSGSGTSVWR